MANFRDATLHVEMGFGAGLLDTPTWTDVTSYVRDIRTVRGRNHELDRIEAGEATLVLDNNDGRFTPLNTAGAYYPDVRPMTHVRIYADYGTATYPIWRGYVERWPLSFPGLQDSVVEVTCVDLFKALSLADVVFDDIYPTLVLGKSPVAFWRMSGASATADSADPGGHTLTWNNAPTTEAAGVWDEDEAVTLDGVDQYASVANEADVELRATASYEFWFKPTPFAADSTDTFNTDDTWECPAGVTVAMFDVWGGGGGGDSTLGSEGYSVGGGGGGGGGFVQAILAVTPGNVYTIDVGAAGTAGNDGADSTVKLGATELIRAYGGKAGENLAGGAGGDGGDVISGALIWFDYRGGSGGNTVRSPGTGGGEAGAETGAGVDGAGSPFPSTDGGAGGSSSADGGDGGDGGDGQAATGTNGAAGSAPGGGGGGGGYDSGNPNTGGAGAAGRVVIRSFTDATTSLFCIRSSADGSLIEIVVDQDGKVYLYPTLGAHVGSLIGTIAFNTWHHCVVVRRWSGSDVTYLAAYLDGNNVWADSSPSYSPPSTTWTTAVGRRAVNNDQYFKGSISEIVVYDYELTQNEISLLYDTQVEKFASERTDQRITHVLDSFGYNLRALEEGQTTMEATDPQVGYLDEIGRAVDTELGVFFMDGAGNATFHDRHFRLIEQSAATAIFGPDSGSGEIPYHDLTPSYDDDNVRNKISITPNVDTTETAVATDDDSIDTYGVRSFRRTTYPASVDEANDMALHLLGTYAEPHIRVGSIEMRLGDDTTLWPIALGGEIGNRYTIKKTMAGDDLDLDVYLERIEHEISRDKTWQVRWELSPAGSGDFWVLGDAELSLLGETTRLAF